MIWRLRQVQKPRDCCPDELVAHPRQRVLRQRVKVLHANLSRGGVSNTAMTHFDGRVFARRTRMR